MLPVVALSLRSHALGTPAAAVNGFEVALRCERSAAGSEVCCASELPGIFRKGSMCASQFTRVGVDGVCVQAVKSL